LSFAFSGEESYILKALQVYEIVSTSDEVKELSIQDGAVIHLSSLLKGSSVDRQTAILSVLSNLISNSGEFEFSSFITSRRLTVTFPRE
jgi:hypothetical protein